MTIARGMRVLATAVLLLVALAACSDDAREPSDEPTADAPAATTSTTAPTPEQRATQQAERKLRQYYATTDRLRQDPTSSATQLRSVAISTELTSQQHLLRSERRKGRHQIGDTRIAALEVQSVNLDNSDPKAGKVPAVQIDVCYDVSDADLVDEDGKSVVNPDRPDAGWIRHTVANYMWDSDPDGAWRVASSQDVERTPCVDQ